MAISKEALIEWLADVPSTADIGVEIGPHGHLALIAVYGADIYLLPVGDVPYEDEKANPEANGHND